MVRWAVDDLLEWRVADHVRIMDQDTPKVDEDKQANAGHAVKREDKGEDVVGQRLRIPIQGMESMTGPRCGHQPLVVRLVDVLVQPWVVFDSVDPVDEEVGENKEHWDREDSVCPSVLADVGVKFRVTTNFHDEPRDGEKVQWNESSHRRLNFKADLILEEPRMLLHLLVEKEVVGQAGKGEVEDEDTNVGDDQQRNGLTDDVVPWQCGYTC